METSQMKRKRDAREAAAGRREEDVDNRSLYICAAEEYGDWFSRYRVQAIKLSDLFSFPDTINPITIYPAGSKSKDNSSVLREVALLDGGDDVPYAMGFCVCGSQITLAGGWFLSPDPKICFAPKPSYVLDTTASEPRFVISSKIPGLERVRMPLPWLREIEGNLYALSAENFAAFHLKTKKWYRLKSLPFPCEHFSFSVFGSMIFATHTESCITYCYNLKWSKFEWTEIGDLFRFEGARNYHDNTLVLDTEDDSEKLMFIFGYSKILVHRILLHGGGRVPSEFELVASIDLPEFPCLSECDDDLSSYSSAHLGDRKVCFSLLYWNAAQVRCLLVLPLEFAYSKSGADFSSTSDQSYLRCTCFRESFAAKALGYHLFKYDYTEDESYFRTSHLGGCFVL
ncbi:PREDICTED: uncharacterized protein LOC101305694 [Fragaria vesca subsp. vesca]|uniref:uncharacterized protein LOC101305694 n=1 Tax=Fragaria vesca subsp. vesca TaxID=101020 RepID=UPI0002C2F4C3|nr:PREDICTED: uncharacterized protein LOC101305694 [Fragaria vesca subsp. vesca]XP_011469110.1 PREDICTED: uncharacterized protein LOC101305694 [Fragaria vesca subsp. vesca]